MRYVLNVFGLGVGLLIVGCSGSRFGVVRNNAPRLPTEVPTAAALVEYLNNNARQLQSLECMKVDLDCRQKLQSVSLDARLACQKPRNFRLGAFGAGSQQVDLGSNDQEFWYWIAKADPAYLYRCSYTDFARGNVAMPFPFQPEWIMEALGMGEYGPAEKYQVAVQRNTVELVETIRSPDGQRLRKITEFNRNPSSVQVRGYRLVDANNKEVYSAQIKEVQQLANGAVVPRKITFKWPAESIELNLRLGRSADDVLVNKPLDQQRTSVLFGRPTLSGVPTYDLARRSLEAPTGIGEVRPAGGTTR